MSRRAAVALPASEKTAVPAREVWGTPASSILSQEEDSMAARQKKIHINERFIDFAVLMMLKIDTQHGRSRLRRRHGRGTVLGIETRIPGNGQQVFGTERYPA